MNCYSDGDTKFERLLLDRLGPRFCAVSGLLVEAVGHVLLAEESVLPHFLTEVGYGLVGPESR